MAAVTEALNRFVFTTLEPYLKPIMCVLPVTLVRR